MEADQKIINGKTKLFKLDFSLFEMIDKDIEEGN